MQDRTLLNPSEAEKLNASLDSFLRLLSGHIFIEASSRVLEWLVRHFRITEFNIDGVMECFLPYHDSPLFVRILSILHLNRSAGGINWTFLEAFKKINQSMPRDSLLLAMEKDSELLRFVVNMLPKGLEESTAHRALINFYTVTLLGFIKRQKTIDENISAILLPAFSRIPDYSDVDARLGAYMVLVSLSRKTRFTSKALKVLVTAITKSHHSDGDAAHLISAVVAICASQDELDSIQKKAASALADIPEIEIWLTEATTIMGSETFLRPLITTMSSHLDLTRYSTVLASLFQSNNLPQVLVAHACSTIARRLAEATRENSSQLDAIKDLGVCLQQRHPQAFAVAVQSFKEAENSDLIQSLEGVLANLTVAEAHAGDAEQSIVLGAFSADTAVRASSTRQLLDSFTNKEDLAPNVLTSLCSALLARVADSESEVLEVLYADPDRLLDAVSHDNLYAAIRDAVARDLPKKQLLTHLDFIASSLLIQHTELSSAAFFDVFLPHLLFTKTNNKTSSAVWDLLLKSELSRLPLLQGVADLFKNGAVDDDETRHDRLAEINLFVAKKIADNLVSSDHYKDLVNSFIKKTSEGPLNSQLFASLVIHALLARVSGEHQVDLGYEVLAFLRTHSQSTFVADEDTTTKLAEDIYTRSKAARTIRQLQIALLYSVAEVGRPVNVKFDFLCDVEAVTENDGRGMRYAALSRAVFRFSNQDGVSSPARTKCLIRLFKTLGDDCLAVLSGIWADHSTPPQTRAAALSLGSAMLQSVESDDTIDYQVVLPSVLVSLSDPSVIVREGGIQCLKVLAGLFRSHKKPKAIFAIDALYGLQSSHVQYLEHNDTAQYIEILLQHSDEILLDGSVLQGIHSASLMKEKGEGKKKTTFKEKVLYFLLSHIVAWRSAHARTTLLWLICNVHSAIKLEMLLPFLQKTVSAIQENQAAHHDLVQPLSASVSRNLLNIFDDTAVSSLNDQANDSFAVLKTCISIPLENAFERSVYDGTLDVLRSSITKEIMIERAIELLQLCVETIVASEQAHIVLKQVISDLLVDTVVIAALIRSMRPTDDTSEPSAKRPKTDNFVSESARSSIRQLSLLVEIVSTKSLPGDINLISVLLETLGMLVNSPSLSSVDVDYTLQLILLAIMNNAFAVQNDVSHSSNSLRIDIVVDLIRTTANPQTSRQALLTVGSLARLSNDSVLHNIMPIFMFMGSTVFQNDDAYSFSVISKTIDSIVPVMANSLKEQRTTQFDLYQRSREFLRVFTDASTHIPRHRRSKFFIHLVDVLGPQDFLVPICLLLVDNTAFRVVKQKAIDVPSTFAIPLACLQKRTISERLSVLQEVMEEAKRLSKKLADASHAEPVTFLDMSKSIDARERIPKPDVALTRQIQALLLFVGTAIELLKTPQGVEDSELDASMKRFVFQLLELAQDPTEGKRDAVISTTAFAALDKAMSIISVPTFSHAILNMLDTDDTGLQRAALSLISRLNNVTAKGRRGIAATMANIIARVVSLVVKFQKDSASVVALQAMDIIARTAMAGEESALAQAAGPLTQFAARQVVQQQLSVLNILDILLGKLGPRLIPNLLPIIELCTSIISTSDEVDLRVKAFTVPSSVLKALPNFVGSYLSRVLDAGLDVSRALPIEVESARVALLRTTAKQIKGRTLLPALEKAWQVTASREAPSVKFLGLYSDLLQRSLRAADRADVLGELRPLFKLFLDIFDVRSSYVIAEASAEFAAVESVALSAFLQVVVKLSDTAFRPLFRKLYDWHLEGGKTARGITFYRLVGSLLDQLKEIITPYMAILFDRTVELLREYATGQAESGELWLEMIDVLRKSFEYDDGGFWRDNTMMKIMSPLVDQIDVCPRITRSSCSSTTPNNALTACLSTMCKSASDDTAKALNLAVWMKARSEVVQTKLCMLSCAQALWKRDGERLSTAGYAAETVAFLVECLEDASEVVENEARVFQRQLTKLVGPLDALID
ncbi:hypothetical protein DACRYDRAFT_23206 [Dacryopinax primogenitus]|uniref:U3 small nucleolar RNA-associated protein 10 n=1 Tax=Dacryopinax primogenitus (strain DJM 731) TaxID=1858805 RepID=M5FVD3_DACPD|nr:uncharacterized protein DACRYDRAFT_23206 [Dacryopinax primogenitus]EJU00234.1 hypothetical protein DACRYDRAFT_23206 [Dacryopinax primogenitus]